MKNNNANVNFKDREGFRRYLYKRVILVATVSLIGLWGFVKILDLVHPPTMSSQMPAMKNEIAMPGEDEVKSPVHPAEPTAQKSTAAHLPPAMVQENTKPAKAVPISEKPKEVVSKSHATRTPTADQNVENLPKRPGVAFINAAIKPLDYELNQRWWGWRPNDILDPTDNINNFQLGVLEATRRTSVILAERLSRTGATASFDPNLERAMNWFMINADRYWFPSAESRYKQGLQELTDFRNKLLSGKAQFYTRTDNLIPLLNAYVDLLGSCEENLVKVAEEDGEPIGYFRADDYFYYAKGVAHTLHVLLEAVEIDFADTIESRRGSEVLHHALEACQRAVEINPILITNSRLSGILANHRANMAAPISHARFYLEVLAKTLST